MSQQHGAHAEWMEHKRCYYFDGVAVVRTLARHDDVAPRCTPIVSVLGMMGMGSSLRSQFDKYVFVLLFHQMLLAQHGCMLQGTQGYLGMYCTGLVWSFSLVIATNVSPFTVIIREQTSCLLALCDQFCFFSIVAHGCFPNLAPA